MVEPPPRNDGHQCDPAEPECRGPLTLRQDSAAPARRALHGLADMRYWGATGAALAAAMALLSAQWQSRRQAYA